MNANLSGMLAKWTQATNEPKWGVQRVFHDVFQAAAAGQTTLIYGSDYRDGKPCLVNTVGAMLTTGGGNGIPSNHFGTIVGLFDQINRALEENGVNDVPGYVSPLAADIFLRNFADLKPMPEPTPLTLPEDVYKETTDEDLAKDLVNLYLTDAPCEIEMDDFPAVAINAIESTDDYVAVNRDSQS